MTIIEAILPLWIGLILGDCLRALINHSSGKTVIFEDVLDSLAAKMLFIAPIGIVFGILL